jgi:hypothetical protein
VAEGVEVAQKQIAEMMKDEDTPDDKITTKTVGAKKAHGKAEASLRFKAAKASDITATAPLEDANTANQDADPSATNPYETKMGVSFHPGKTAVPGLDSGVGWPTAPQLGMKFASKPVLSGMGKEIGQGSFGMSYGFGHPMPFGVMPVNPFAARPGAALHPFGAYSPLMYPGMAPIQHYVSTPYPVVAGGVVPHPVPVPGPHTVTTIHQPYPVPYAQPLAINTPIPVAIHTPVSGAPTSVVKDHTYLDMFEKPLPITPASVLPRPHYMDRFGNFRTPFTAGGAKMAAHPLALHGHGMHGFGMPGYGYGGVGMGMGMGLHGHHAMGMMGMGHHMGGYMGYGMGTLGMGYGMGMGGMGMFPHPYGSTMGAYGPMNHFGIPHNPGWNPYHRYGNVIGGYHMSNVVPMQLRAYGFDQIMPGMPNLYSNYRGKMPHHSMWAGNTMPMWAPTGAHMLPGMMGTMPSFMGFKGKGTTATMHSGFQSVADPHDPNVKGSNTPGTDPATEIHSLESAVGGIPDAGVKFLETDEAKATAPKQQAKQGQGSLFAALKAKGKSKDALPRFKSTSSRILQKQATAAAPSLGGHHNYGMGPMGFPGMMGMNPYMMAMANGGMGMMHPGLMYGPGFSSGLMAPGMAGYNHMYPGTLGGHHMWHPGMMHPFMYNGMTGYPYGTFHPHAGMHLPGMFMPPHPMLRHTMHMVPTMLPNGMTMNVPYDELASAVGKDELAKLKSSINDARTPTMGGLGANPYHLSAHAMNAMAMHMNGHAHMAAAAGMMGGMGAMGMGMGMGMGTVPLSSPLSIIPATAAHFYGTGQHIMHDIFSVNSAVHQANMLAETHEHSASALQAHIRDMQSQLKNVEHGLHMEREFAAKMAKRRSALDLDQRRVAAEYELSQLEHQYHGVNSIAQTFSQQLAHQAAIKKDLQGHISKMKATIRTTTSTIDTLLKGGSETAVGKAEKAAEEAEREAQQLEDQASKLEEKAGAEAEKAEEKDKEFAESLDSVEGSEGAAQPEEAEGQVEQEAEEDQKQSPVEEEQAPRAEAEEAAEAEPPAEGVDAEAVEEKAAEAVEEKAAEASPTEEEAPAEEAPAEEAPAEEAPAEEEKAAEQAEAATPEEAPPAEAESEGQA